MREVETEGTCEGDMEGRLEKRGKREEWIQVCTCTFEQQFGLLA